MHATPADPRDLGMQLPRAIADILTHDRAFLDTVIRQRPLTLEGTVTAIQRNNTGLNQIKIRRTGQGAADATWYTVWATFFVPKVGDVVRMLQVGKGALVLLGAKHGGRPNEWWIAYSGGALHMYDSAYNHVHKHGDDHHHRHYHTDGATILHHHHGTAGHHAHTGDHYHSAGTIGDTGTTTTAHRHTHQSGQYEHHYGTQRLLAHHPTDGHKIYAGDGATILHHHNKGTGAHAHVGDHVHNASSVADDGTPGGSSYQRHRLSGGQYEHHFGTQRLRAHHPSNGHLIYDADGTTIRHRHGLSTGMHQHSGDHYHNVGTINADGTVSGTYHRSTHNVSANQYEHYLGTQLLRHHHPTNGHAIYNSAGTAPQHYHTPSGQHIHTGDHYHNAATITGSGTPNTPYIRHTRNHAVADPTAAPSLSLVSGSLLAGTYTVGYCWTASNGAGFTSGNTVVSPTAAITVGAGQAIRVGALTLPTGASGVGYYFTAVPGGGTVGQVATSNGAATTLGTQGNGQTAPVTNSTLPRYERYHEHGDFNGAVLAHAHDVFSVVQHHLDDGTGTGTRAPHQHDRQGHTHPFSGHRYDSDETWATVANPVFSPSLSLVSGSLLPGTYHVAYAWTNANGTTMLSLADVITVGSSQAIAVGSLLPFLPPTATGVSYWFTSVPGGGTTGLVATGSGGAITLGSQGNGAGAPSSNTTAAPIGRLRAKHGPTGHTALDHDGTSHRAWAFSGSTAGQHTHSYSAHTHPKGHIVGDDGAGTAVGKLYHQHATGGRAHDFDGAVHQHYSGSVVHHKILSVGTAGGQTQHKQHNSANFHLLGDDGTGKVHIAHASGKAWDHDNSTHQHYSSGTIIHKIASVGTAGGQIQTKQHNSANFHLHGDDGTGLLHLQHAGGNRVLDHDGTTHSHYAGGVRTKASTSTTHTFYTTTNANGTQPTMFHVAVGAQGGQTRHQQQNTFGVYHQVGDDGTGSHHIQSTTTVHNTRLLSGTYAHTHQPDSTTRPSGVVHSHPVADGSIHHNLTSGGGGALKRATHATTPQVVGTGSATISGHNIHIAQYTYPSGAPGDPHLKLLSGCVWDSGSISNPGFYSHNPAAIISNTDSAYSNYVYNTLGGGQNTSYAWGTTNLSHTSVVDLYATKIGAPGNLAVGTALWQHIIL